MEEFRPFPKIARLNRDMILTEKIDGTNAQVFINDFGDVLVGSRTRYITPESDNHGFARWCEGNKNDLLTLGPGRHFGEWWGQGINRGYGLKEKRLSLFNVQRWVPYGTEPGVIPSFDPTVVKMQDVLPECVGLVPIIHQGLFDLEVVDFYVNMLETFGSLAVPGYSKPEGVVVWHTAANIGFKRTLEDDGMPKSLANAINQSI